MLESFGLTGRLASGRRYARRGQVLALQIDTGEVSATVQGSRTTPYRVRIGLPAFPDRVWTAVERALADRAVYGARLLAGEMPADIEAVFADAGAPLFPQHGHQLDMSCTCPDPVVPCKHLAATVYLLAEAFDEDPFRILRWRGRERGQLLARLRRGDPPAPVTGAAHALAEVASRPLAEELDRFWLPPVPLAARPATVATVPDLLLRQLPAPGAALGGAELTAQLYSAYRRFAAAGDDPGVTPDRDPHPDGDSSQGSVRSK